MIDKRADRRLTPIGSAFPAFGRSLRTAASGVLDRRLAVVERDGGYVAGALSVADFAILGWAWRDGRHRVDLATIPTFSAGTSR